MNNRFIPREPTVSPLRQLLSISTGGLLALALSGCASHPSMSSMAPGPTVDHGFPGVAISQSNDQWPSIHGPEQNTEHRIYTEAPPASHPISRPAPLAPHKTTAPSTLKPAAPATPAIQKTVYFSFNSARLSYWDKIVLDRVSEEIQKSPYRLVLLHGSTDPLGSEVYNKKLGLWRALSVKHYLISRKIPASKLRALSWGDKKTRAFSSCRKKSPLCHSQSRSVRLDIVR